MTCQHHPDLTLIHEVSRFAGDIWVCPNRSCNYAVSANQTDSAKASALPSSINADALRGDPGNTRTGESDAVERLLVARIKAKLEADGYQVLVVGQKNARGSGSSVGYPDLSVRRNATEDGRPGWPRGMAALIEVKTTTGRVRKEQQELFDDEWSFIVRNETEAQAALATLEVK